MFNAFKGKFRFQAAPRIVHRLPGRVRIHYPPLTRVSTDWYRFATPVAELVNIKKGILSTDIRPVSGSVLICYDTDLLNVNEVLQWLELMIKIVLKNSPMRVPFSEDILKSLLKRVRIQLMSLEQGVEESR